MEEKDLQTPETQENQTNASESREGYQQNYQREYRPGRSPRPRIHTGQRPAFNNDRQGYNRRSSDDEAGFRPEGFGAGLQSSPRPSYRPRTNYGQQGTSNGYQPRQQGGYNSQYSHRPNTGRPQGDNSQRPQRPYRPYNASDDQQGGYQPRQPRQGYQPRQQGGYNPQYAHNSHNAHNSQYAQRPQRSQYGAQAPRPFKGKGQGWGNKPRTADYDPNAKYSMKKRIEYKEIHYDPTEPVRLNKFLANAGVCSRREADEFIQAGVVTVNGNVVTELGTKILRTDDVRFHDQPVTLEKKVYVLLNKPKDYVTTSDDPQQRKTVMDLVKNACPERIYPVGRLDRNTTGVLLLTNDGDLASKLTHPKYLKKKIYHVYLDKPVTAHDLTQIAQGIQLEDGEVHADDVQYADAVDKKQVGLEIHSGKNRIVRRIFESLGYRVTKLDRVQFAGLTKKNLRRGDWRYLSEEEVDRLRMGAYE